MRSIHPMKPLAMALSATLVLGCAHEPAPRAASTTREPILLPGAAQPRCDADTLARASLWSGSIVSRTAMTLPATTQRVVYDGIVRCDHVDPKACKSWAEDKIRNVRVDVGDGVERRVEAGSERRGTMWNLLVDGEREGHLVQTNRDFARVFRRLAAAGKTVEVTDRVRVAEPRGRLHLRVIAPQTSVAAERWTLEHETSEMAIVELNLALDDLETAGIHVHERRALDDVGWKITPIAQSAYLTTPLRDESAGRTRTEIVVSCAE